MIVLSWDIGEKNLAFCKMSKESDEDFIILDWQVIDLTDLTADKRMHICSSLTAKKSPCKKRGIFAQDNLFFCKTHFNGPKEKNKGPKKNKGNLSLQQLCTNLIIILDQITDLLTTVDVILVEYQPNKKASVRIKQIMSLLFAYLTIRSVDRKIKCKIITQSTKNKLSWYDGPVIETNIKSNHARNKFLAIQQMKYHLNNNVQDSSKWLAHFESFKKKDDLADSFLQGGFYLSK